MIDIMTHIHKYVPRKPNGDLIPIFFGGDQLTRERAGGAEDARLQAPDSASRLQGVKPKVEDWHALVTFYQVYTCVGRGFVLIVVFFLLCCIARS